jgi:antitoxin PrlF
MDYPVRGSLQRVPETVHRGLMLGKCDKIHSIFRSDGEIVLTRASDSDGDGHDL